MVYKLIPVDSTQSYKVTLPVGKHIIGRGKFLLHNVDDNKVSRNHAELEITQDTVTIKSLHVNPCFFIKKDTNETQILTQDTTTSLCNGDKFGILPQTYWYELINILEEDIQGDNKEIIRNSTEEGVVKDVDIKEEEQIGTDDGINTAEYETLTVKDNFNVTFENGDSPESLSLLRNISPSQDFDCNTAPSSPSDIQADSAQTPVKRPHSLQEPSSSDASKKVKTEPETGDGESAGPSNEQVIKKESNDEPAVSPAQVASKAQLRERCLYGANCYRKNPQHKVEFSHPQDPDWDENQRQCRFGANCRRRHPQHWRDYIHPPGVNPPNPNRPGKKRQKVRNRSTDDEVSLSTKFVVTGKRVRKTIKKQDWSDSESCDEPDPYGTDDSDDWVPPADATVSQDYTQDWD